MSTLSHLLLPLPCSHNTDSHQLAVALSAAVLLQVTQLQAAVRLYAAADMVTLQELAGATLAGFFKGLTPADEAAVREDSLAALHKLFPAGSKKTTGKSCSHHQAEPAGHAALHTAKLLFCDAVCKYVAALQRAAWLHK